LLTDQSRRRTLGLNGYQAYLKKWTAEVHIERYLGLIHRVAEQRGYSLD
jgi:hypothetical protein